MNPTGVISSFPWLGSLRFAFSLFCLALGGGNAVNTGAALFLRDCRFEGQLSHVRCRVAAACRMTASVFSALLRFCLGCLSEVILGSW